MLGVDETASAEVGESETGKTAVLLPAMETGESIHTCPDSADLPTGDEGGVLPYNAQQELLRDDLIQGRGRLKRSLHLGAAAAVVFVIGATVTLAVLVICHVPPTNQI